VFFQGPYFLCVLYGFSLAVLMDNGTAEPLLLQGTSGEQDTPRSQPVSTSSSHDLSNARSHRWLLAMDAQAAREIQEAHQFYNGFVSFFTIPFLLAIIILLCTQVEGLESLWVWVFKHPPGELSWKEIFGLSLYAGAWLLVVRSSILIILKPFVEHLSLSHGRAIVLAHMLAAFPGMMCLVYYLGHDLSSCKRNDANAPPFCGWASLAAKEQAAVLVLALLIKGFDGCRQSTINNTLNRLRRYHSATRDPNRRSIRRAGFVHHMPTVPWQPEAKDGNNGETDCPICTSPFCSQLAIVRTPCNHLFHKQCLAKWCRSHNVCPMCRGDLRHSQDLQP